MTDHIEVISRGPVRVAVWGLGRVYQRCIPTLLRMQDEGQIRLVAAIDSAPQDDACRDGIPVMMPDDLVGSDPDYLVIMNAAHAAEIADRAVGLGIPRERILGHGILGVTGLDLRRLEELRRLVPSILSNDLWGGLACATLGITGASPLVGTSLADRDYLKLLSDPVRYLSVDAPGYRGVRISSGGSAYHACLLEDVEVRLPADVGFDEAWERWRSGCVRMDWGNVFFEMSTCDPDVEREFHELRGGRRGVCLVPYQSDLEGTVTLPLGEGRSFAPCVARAASGGNPVGGALLGLLLGCDISRRGTGELSCLREDHG